MPRLTNMPSVTKARLTSQIQPTMLIVKNTAISTATRQLVSGLVKNVTKAIGGLFGGKK
jgi:hypothetical protein